MSPVNWRASMLQRSQHDIPERDPAMVALKINRSRQFFMAVHRASGDSRYFLIGDNRLAILNYSYEAANECYIEGLPDARAPWWLRNGRQETINRTHMMARWFLNRIVFYLHFIAAAKIDAAVGIARAIDINSQFKILELSIRDYIRAGRFVF